MLILLLTFNDPWYFLHIKNPSFATYFIGEVGTAMFVAGMLVFWLVDIARHKEPELSPDATKLQKFVHKSMTFNYGIGMALGIFYAFLVVNLITLYGLFYWAVRFDPGEAEISYKQDKHPKLKPILFGTYLLLAVYYIIYLLMLC